MDAVLRSACGSRLNQAVEAAAFASSDADGAGRLDRSIACCFDMTRLRLE